MMTVDVGALTELLSEWDTQASDDDSARIQAAHRERVLKEVECEARVKVRREMTAQLRVVLGL